MAFESIAYIIIAPRLVHFLHDFKFSRELERLRARERSRLCYTRGLGSRAGALPLFSGRCGQSANVTETAYNGVDQLYTYLLGAAVGRRLEGCELRRLRTEGKRNINIYARKESDIILLLLLMSAADMRRRLNGFAQNHDIVIHTPRRFIDRCTYV